MASETEPFQLCLVQIDIYLPNLVTFSDFRLEESLYIRCCLVGWRREKYCVEIGPGGLQKPQFKNKFT